MEVHARIERVSVFGGATLVLPWVCQLRYGDAALAAGDAVILKQPDGIFCNPTGDGCPHDKPGFARARLMFESGSHLQRTEMR